MFIPCQIPEIIDLKKFTEIYNDFNSVSDVAVSAFAIDLIHKSQNAAVPYRTMFHSEQKYAHFCSEWSIVEYGTGAFWDL